MEEDGQSDAGKCAPASTEIDVMPILEHVRPVGANFCPRVYRQNEEQDSSVLLASSNTSSPLMAGNNVDIRKQSGEAKPFPESSTSQGKSAGRKSSLKAKGVSPSICIDVEPLKSLSANGAMPKTMRVKCDREISESEKKPLQFVNKNDSDDTKVVFVDNAWDVSVSPKRSSGRPRGPRKKRHGKNFSYGMTPRTKARNIDPVKRYMPEDFRNSDSPRKKVKATSKSCDENVKVDKSNADEKGPTSSAWTSIVAVDNDSDVTPRCNICNRVFSTPVRLQNHMHWHVKNKVFKCKVCEKTFKSFGHYIRHQQAHKANRTVPKSPQSVSSVDAQTSNESTSNTKGQKVHKCNICSRPYRQILGLKLHLLSHEKDHPIKQYRCTMCPREFKKFGWLKQHALKFHDIEKVNKSEARIHHPKSKAHLNMLKKQALSNKKRSVDQDEENDLRSKKPMVNKCDICNKTFSVIDSLIRHKELHMGNGYIPRIRKRRKLNENQTSVQVKEENEQSNAEQLHQCNKCDRSFRSVHGLRRHLSSHREPAKPVVDTKENTSYSLRRASSRSISCCASPKATSQLLSHEKSFHCLSCSESFPTESELKAHVEKVHLKEEETSTKPESENREWIKYWKENGKFVYRCGLCTNSDRPFAAVASVRKHVGMVHRDYTENLVEPAGIYEDVQSEPSTSTPNNPPSLSSDPSDTPGSSNDKQTCTCSGRGKSNKLTHLSGNCPVHDKESSEPTKKLKGSQILRCKHCSEEYDEFSREEFQKHELSHELEAKEPSGMTYACFECELEFTMVNELMDHYDKEH